MNNKKNNMEEKYNILFKYTPKGVKLTPAEFHSLTYNVFTDINLSEVIGKFGKDDFELFWEFIQEKKGELK